MGTWGTLGDVSRRSPRRFRAPPRIQRSAQRPATSPTSPHVPRATLTPSTVTTPDARTTRGRSSMAAHDLLGELERRGVELAVDGDRLRYRPKDAVTPELRAAIVQHKSELLALIDEAEAEVRWRANVM